MVLKMKESYAMLERRRGAILKKLAKGGPFIIASAVEVKVKCGNAKCVCAKDKGARHEKLHLVWANKEGHGTQYVPVDLQEEVLEWVANYWELKEKMKEMSALSHRMIGMYVKTRKRYKGKGT